MIKLGVYNDLVVLRLSDLGYMLAEKENDIDEVLLHFSQAKEEHKPGDKVHVFIYADKKDRPTATEEEVYATLDKSGIAEVVDVIANVGVFVNINTPKDVLLSSDYLPYDKNIWPQKGDKVLVHLKQNHQALTAKPLNRFDLIGLHKNVSYLEGEIVKGYVYRVNDAGVSVFTMDYMHVFVPTKLTRKKYRMGEEVSVHITKSLDSKEYYGSLIGQKEEMIDPDKELILKYLDEHNGVMPLAAKSSSEEVYNVLKLSRKAFKRALGGLYKEKKITFNEDETKTTLIK